MLSDDYKAWDECPDADECELIYEFCKLTDAMIKDIQHLKAECIRTRYELSKYLKTPYDEYLRSDILSDLGGDYYDSKAFQEFSRIMYDGGNPFDFEKYLSSIRKLCKGIDDQKY